MLLKFRWGLQQSILLWDSDPAWGSPPANMFYQELRGSPLSQGVSLEAQVN